jgi:iron complex outermembrane receptor protein
MLNPRCFFFFFLVLLTTSLSAQNCEISVQGIIRDIKSKEAIANASIYSLDAEQGAVSNRQGYFQLQGLCAGDLHLLVSHIGCSPSTMFLSLNGDTSLVIWLDHSNEILDEVAVRANVNGLILTPEKSLNQESINENAGADLATILEGLNGVASIGNGAKISKPVVHGLYGNRISIVNNGVVHSGQQWGNDHAPEIDPLMAGRVSVLKGAAAIEYMGSSLGSVVLVEPLAMSNDPHVHGAVQYMFESNGRGHVVNTRLEQKGWLNWRLAGSLKKSGDQKTANYYLRNTGREEANAVLQLEKRYAKKWVSKIYYSLNNSVLGVLRGSQIGNLTDLQVALEREEPFYTERGFSYRIEAPRQEVQHQLLKFSQLWSISKNSGLELHYAWQFNARQEFDLRRSDRSARPAMSLGQATHFWELKYRGLWAAKWHYQTALQYSSRDNYNVPETGILPLVPDYISREWAAFFRMQRQWGKWSMDLGARADYIVQNVATISISVPREVLRYQNRFLNPKASWAFSYWLKKGLKASLNTGYSQRNPAINELYSNGLHQGVSGIEEGDPNLLLERSFKSSLELSYQANAAWQFEALAFVQTINNFIYLQPQDELRLTIRGAFPVFQYQQDNALLRGLEWQVNFDPDKAWSAKLNYSYLRGDNTEQDIPLVFMPANRIYGELNYRLPSLGAWEKLEFQIANRYVFEQKHLLSNQDFSPPPAAYSLLSSKLSAERQMAKNRWHFFLKADNILNSSFRDYLNRQRYFADDMGLNISLGMGLKF